MEIFLSYLLVHFLSDHWDNDYLAAIVGGKQVFITIDEYCYSYQAVNNRMIKFNEKTSNIFTEKRTRKSYFILLDPIHMLE